MAADGETRTEKFPFGIASVGLGEVERQVPLDEPPPLPPNAALNVIGKPTPRQNGRAKVTGATRFTVDIVLPGMLHGPRFCARRCRTPRFARSTSRPPRAFRACAPCWSSPDPRTRTAESCATWARPSPRSPPFRRRPPVKRCA